MEHLKSISRARLVWLALLLGVGLQLPLLACSVPVFRYALERWPPDTYRYVIFHNGPLTPEQQTLVDQLDQIKMLGYGRPTLLGYTVDVSQEIEETFAPLWEEHKDASLPLLILLPPMPVAGSHSSFRDNKTISIRPTQNKGVAYEIIASMDMSASRQLLTFIAARRPSSVPTPTERTSVAPMSNNVGHRRSRIKSRTGRLCLKEKPRSS